MNRENPQRKFRRVIGLVAWSLVMLALGALLGVWLTACAAAPSSGGASSSSLTQASEGLASEPGAEASQAAAEQSDDTEGEQEADASAGSTEAEGASSSAEAESAAEPEETEADSDAAITAQAQEILASMTLEEQVYQMFIVTPETLTGLSTVTQAGTTTKAALQAHPVGGLVYFAANILTPEQCTTMISNTQSYSEIGLFIAVDEEGGRVARIGNNSAMGTTSFSSMSTIGSSGDVSKAYEVGSTIGTEIAQFGFNLDFAPVADVNSNPNNTVIGDRAFGSDPELVAEMVASAVQGFRDSGMLCTLKHFPGHGDTDTDSHYGYTEVLKTLQELRSVEFLPFQAGIDAGADFVMMGHISVPEVTGDDTPASLSATMIGILRDELNFQGLIITDSMVMSAITDRYTSAQAAVLAVQAGVDVILEPSSLTGAVQGILSAVEEGAISEERIQESVLRILETKIRSGIIAPAS
ncbi:MAG: glycoside hydrolase family 3 protein [Clostridiales bacterium]|nr:glycoside hydrolase family 3 protein [Clostridiales bacterium]